MGHKWICVWINKMFLVKKKWGWVNYKKIKRIMNVGNGWKDWGKKKDKI